MLKPFYERKSVEPQNTSTVLPMATVIHLTGETPTLECKFAETKLQNSVTLQNLDQKLNHYLGGNVVK